MVGIEGGLTETGLAVLKFFEDALRERPIIPYVWWASIDTGLYRFLRVFYCVLEAVEPHQLEDVLLIEELTHHWQLTQLFKVQQTFGWSGDDVAGIEEELRGCLRVSGEKIVGEILVEEEERGEEKESEEGSKQLTHRNYYT